MENLKFIKRIVLATTFTVGSGLTIAGGMGIFVGRERFLYAILMIAGIIFLVIGWLVIPGIFRRLE